jgi:hypothetical protein
MIEPHTIEGRTLARRVYLRAGHELEAELIPRLDAQSYSKIIKRDLRRYYRLLDKTRQQLDTTFTRSQLLSIIDALLDQHFTPERIRKIPELSAGHFALRSSNKHRLELSRPLASLTELQLHALADLVEQVRSDTWPDPSQPIRARLAQLLTAK